MSSKPTPLRISVPSTPDLEPIVVLSDGETFSPLAGARIYDVHTNLGTEEIEDALAKDLLVPVIEFCCERLPTTNPRWEVLEEDNGGLFITTKGSERIGPFSTRIEAEAEADRRRRVEAP